MRRRRLHLTPRAAVGLTLVELLVALSLMALITLTVSNMLVKINVGNASLDGRFRLVGEVQTLVQDLRDDFKRGVYISDNSHANRLEYTTYDRATLLAVKKIYTIVTSGGKTRLQLSVDGGTTQTSPYRLGGITSYELVGTPQFLLAGPANECTLFTDSDANGYWQSGVDTAGSYVSCLGTSSSTPLSTPSQASKVILKNFQFSTGKGAPPTTRSLPSELFIKANPGLVRSTLTPATGVKDPSLVQSFAVNTANSRINISNLLDIAWDPVHERLAILDGTSRKIFLTDRAGVLMGQYMGQPVSGITTGFLDAAFEQSGNSLIVVPNTGSTPLYRVLLADMPVLTPSNSVDPGVANSSVAMDPNTPDDFYIWGGTSIYQRSIFSGASTGGPWTVPAGTPSSLDIEPVSGDFLLLYKDVTTTSGQKYIQLVRLTRASVSSQIPVNISDWGVSTVTNVGFAYDALLNRLFISDGTSQKIYEVIPDRLITARE